MCIYLCIYIYMYIYIYAGKVYLHNTCKNNNIYIYIPHM